MAENTEEILTEGSIPSKTPEVGQEIVDEVTENVSLSPGEVIQLDLNSITLETPEVVHYNNYEIEAILELTQAIGYTYSEEEGLKLVEPKKDFPTAEDIEKLAKEKENEIRKNNLYSNLSNMCTILTYTIKQWLSSKYVTPDQQERYEIKAKAARDNKVEYFVDEAALLGIEPEVLMGMVLEMSNQWQAVIEMSAIKIDAIRVYIKSQIETDIDFAEFVIEYFRTNLDTLDLETPIKETVDLIKSEYSKTKSE